METLINPEARESVPEPPNPLGMCGIEFVEYRTGAPQALGRVLEAIGFRPVARHRSREVLLYRQGTMNVVVDAHRPMGAGEAQDREACISAVAFRVRDAAFAWSRCQELGAWPVASHAQAMELNLPAIRGPGAARYFFVDRWQEFSIYDVDFRPLPGLATKTLVRESGLDWFGLVQYTGWGRSAEWIAFYKELFGFEPIPDDTRFGVLPRGTLLRSACSSFYWQLVEPQADASVGADVEELHRAGIGAPSVLPVVQRWRSAGVEFVETEHFHPNERGALTKRLAGGVAFELVHREPGR